MGGVSRRRSRGSLGFPPCGVHRDRWGGKRSLGKLLGLGLIPAGSKQGVRAQGEGTGQLNIELMSVTARGSGSGALRPRRPNAVLFSEAMLIQAAWRGCCGLGLWADIQTCGGSSGSLLSLEPVLQMFRRNDSPCL